ncbi:hypothetical protein G6F18_012570 [Rhizopus arrhizus]|nr:hypothetical protein G6F18_012570 [Rhizopus arrhizus]
MVLPANKNLVPNKAIDGANSNFLQTKKSWAQLLVGPNKTSSYGVQSSTSPNSRSTDAVSENLPSSTSSPSVIPSFNQPFIKGTVAGSVFLDVTPVKDKHLFFQELRQVCNDNEHLWSFEDKVKRAGQKIFAEILLSPSMRQTICSTGVNLPSLSTKLIGYPSLSPDADILQITFTNLPRQYGRLNGGLEQLRSDMIQNLSAFGQVLDSGIICGTAGLFSGRGYALLELTQKGSAVSQGNDTVVQRLLPSHNLDWAYRSFNISTEEDNDVPSVPDNVLVYATFASMAPYCRYCHSEDHALVDCPVKLASIVCYNCNVPGHKSRSCPRKNAPAFSGVSNKKARKTPAVVKTILQRTATMPSDVNPTAGVGNLAPKINEATTSSGEISSSASPESAQSSSDVGQKVSKYTTGAVTRSKAKAASAETMPPRTASDVNGVETSTATNNATAPSSSSGNRTTSVPICKHCGLEGHQRTAHHACLQNPQYLASISSTSTAAANTEGEPNDPMVEDTQESSASSQTENVESTIQSAQHGLPGQPNLQ